MTLSFGSVARLLIRLPVMPSLRYSWSGSPLTFLKGRTAIESMTLEILRVREEVVVDEPGKFLVVDEERPVDPGIDSGSRRAILPESESRLSRCKSARMSAAC